MLITAPTVPEVGLTPVIVGFKTGSGATTTESKLPLTEPSIDNCALTLVFPGAAVRSTPTHRKKRSATLIATAPLVAQLSAYAVTVVVSAFVPVLVQSGAPVAEFTSSFALGYIVATLAVFFIHSVNDTIEPAGIVPVAFGCEGSYAST